VDRIPLRSSQEKESASSPHEEALHGRIVGQNDAVVAVSRAIRRLARRLKDASVRLARSSSWARPASARPSSARAREYLFGDENALIRVDMSEYMEKFSVSRLLGPRPATSATEEGGVLTEKVRRRPYSVVLFDEIEKAHPDIFNMLLQVLDDGRLTDSIGHVVDFKNAILIDDVQLGHEPDREADVARLPAGVGSGELTRR